jgi:hypothetical protein
MTVFSYTTSFKPALISEYANEQISTYAEYVVSEFGNSQNNLFNIDSSPEHLEEQRAYSYDESAVVGLESTDYGFISEAHVLDDDFGLVTDTTNYAYQRIDYGFLTPNTTIKPFGKIGNIAEFADVTLVRNSVGGVVFLMYGSAKIFVLPIHIGRGSFLARGDAATAFSPQVVGAGSLFSFVSTTTVKASKQDGAGLFKLTSTSTNSFTPAPYIGSGSLFGLSSTTYSESNVEKTGDTSLFRFSGGNSKETSVNSYVGRGSLFSFISHTESVAYSYNESSVVTVDCDDCGFITESPVSEDDYLTVGDTALNYPWQFANYGNITDNETRLPFGRFQIKSESGIVNSPAPICSGTIKVSGDAKIYVLPIHLGSGVLRLYTATVPAFSPKVIGAGSLFGFSGAAEATAPKISTETALFRVTGRAAEATVPTTHIGAGTLFGIVGTTYATGSNPPESTALFRISGAATNEQRAYGYFGTGTLFGIGGKVERVAYAYNESSVVAPDCLDYGFVSAAPDYVPDPEEDYGLITDLDIRLPWQKLDYGFITDFETRLPFGQLQIEGAAQTPASVTFVAEGRATFAGEVDVYVTPIHIGSGTATISGTVIPKFQLRTTGSGRMFGFGSGAESTGSNPPESTELFKIAGEATNIQATLAHLGSGSINLGQSSPGITGDGSRGVTIFRLKHFGSGSLFKNGVGGEATVSRPTRGIELFRIIGNVTYQRNFNYNITEASFGSVKITGAATNVEFSRYQIGSGGPNITGAAVPIFRLKHFGSGTFSNITGAAEATGANPPDQTVLFRINGSAKDSQTAKIPATTVETKLFGSATEKNAESYVGSGSLFAVGGSSQIFKVSADASGLFKISGRATESTSPGTYAGSGSLFTFISKTESVGANPPVSGLFKIAGSVEEKNAESYIGSGSLFTFIGATESASNVAPTEGIFRISGSATERNTESYNGSGSLFTFVSATESDSNAESAKGLFRITGTAGVYRVFPTYNGSGRVFGFSGGAESTGANPPVSGLFKLTGSATEKNTEAYRGTGSLFTFVSTTEASVVNPPEQTALFRINGSADVARGFPVYEGSGSLFTFVSKTEAFAVAPKTATIFTFTGSATEKNTEAYLGSGAFGTGFGLLTGGALSFIFTYNLTKVLFQIQSGATESFVPATYDGSVLIDINGTVVNDRYVVYVPPKPTRIYVI